MEACERDFKEQQDLNKVLGAKVGELLVETAYLKKKADGLEQVIEAADRWMTNRKERGITCFNVGEKVKRDGVEQPVTIKKVIFQRGGTFYKISWFDSEGTTTEKVHSDCLSPLNDCLPIRSSGGLVQ